MHTLPYIYFCSNSISHDGMRCPKSLYSSRDLGKSSIGRPPRLNQRRTNSEWSSFIPRLGSVSSLRIRFSLYMKETNYFPCFRAANQALSATPVLIAAALFKIGDRVKAIPDTARGIDPKHSVAFYGTVAEVEKTETCWMYTLLSDQHARSHLTVPESRVRPMPISWYPVILW